MAVIGIDLGGQTIKAGIVNRNGTIREKVVILTEAKNGRNAVVSNILKVAKVLLDKDRTIRAIGVGIPGIVDSKGYITHTPNIPLSKYDLGKEMKKKLKNPKIIFGNDADNFTRAIHRFGIDKKKKNIVTLTLGTGIGSGLIINGMVFANKGAPELGHTTIKFDSKGSVCCGNNGCIESFLGRKCFKESPLEIYKKAWAGDALALKRYKDYGKYLGIAIANFINIFNPDVIILGGEVRNAYRFFRKSMEEEVKKRALFSSKIIKSEIIDAGIIGAAILAF